MLSMRAQLDLYEEICSLSAHMVAAARTNDWDHLICLERKVAALRDQLAAGTDPDVDVIAAAPELDRKRGLIRRILEDDAEIRRHTEPWMEQVRQFLGGQSRRLKVQQAYGATDSGLVPGPGGSARV